MKTLIEIERLYAKVSQGDDMSYDSGVEQALAWVLDKMEDDESKDFEEQF